MEGFKNNQVSLEVVEKDGVLRLTITRPRSASSGRFSLKVDLDPFEAAKLAEGLLSKALGLRVLEDSLAAVWAGAFSGDRVSREADPYPVDCKAQIIERICPKCSRSLRFYATPPGKEIDDNYIFNARCCCGQDINVYVKP